MIVKQSVKGGTLLFLPLGPSTNARMRPVRMGRFCRNILTDEARDYIDTIGRQLKRIRGVRPLDSHQWVDLWFILPRTNCDAHNYDKVLFDALQAGGMVTNYKYILPRFMGIWHDSKEAGVIVKIPAQSTI